MSRWESGAGDRIAHAALELFAEQGFENTTVAQIAERAGVTRRTYFRHFADKRDVVFGDHDRLAETVAEVVAAAPAGSSVMDVLRQALEVLADSVFVDQQSRMRVLRGIVRSDVSLRERDEHKNAVIAAAGEQAFRERGFGETEARLAAGLGVLALSTALDRWIDAPDGADLRGIAVDVVDSIRRLACEP
jgi:AcrR family transcriptional regulator